MPEPLPDHYAALGLDRNCTLAQIRAAYRLLARRHHPDVNPDGAQAMQALNAAHETLADPARRRAYDRELSADEEPKKPAAKHERNVKHDARLRVEDLLRGITLDIRVNDPANPAGAETYRLTVPPDTAPNTRLRIPRAEPFADGFIEVRLRPMSSARWKVRGSDLRCDLRLRPQRATAGGVEMIPGPLGKPLRVQIPRGIARGEIIRIPGEGLARPRGGHGDLLVRVTYRVEVRIERR